VATRSASAHLHHREELRGAKSTSRPLRMRAAFIIKRCQLQRVQGGQQAACAIGRTPMPACLAGRTGGRARLRPAVWRSGHASGCWLPWRSSATGVAEPRRSELDAGTATG
jgi:hypothetical protein